MSEMWYLYNLITNPISMIFERRIQMIESLKKIVNKKFSRIFDITECTAETVDIGVIEKNASYYYDIKSVKIAEGVQFMQGTVLTADNKCFGEFSGVGFNAKKTLIAVSDRGAYYLQANGIDSHVIGSITLEGSGVKKDFEELVVFGNDCFVSNEYAHQILYYKDCHFVKNPIEVATAFNKSNFFYNKGIEAFDVDQESNFFAISEYPVVGETDNTIHKAFLWSTSEGFTSVVNSQTLDYISSPGYGVSSLICLTNGDVLVLERWYKHKFFGFAEDYEVKVKYVKEEAILQGGQIHGKTIIHIDNESVTGKYGYADNFESIAVIENNNGNTELYLLTDDNRALFQRTILLKFEIDLDVVGQILQCEAEEQHCSIS